MHWKLFRGLFFAFFVACQAPPGPLNYVPVESVQWENESFWTNYPLTIPDTGSQALQSIESVLGDRAQIPALFAQFLREKTVEPIDLLEKSLYNDALGSGKDVPDPRAYAYASGQDTLYLNLYLDSRVSLNLAGGKVSLTVDAAYPWSENNAMQMMEAPGKRFVLALRIPASVRNQAIPADKVEYLYHSNRTLVLRVNEEITVPTTVAGYAMIDRVWESGDQISWQMPIAVRRSKKQGDSLKQLVLERGPIVYIPQIADSIQLSGARQYQSFSIPTETVQDSIIALRGPGWNGKEWTEIEAYPYFWTKQNGEAANKWWYLYR